jgi:hypothetical protein
VADMEIPPYWQAIMATPPTDSDLRNALIGSVESGLKEFFIKRAGNDCAAYSKDGEVGVRLNGVFSLDEMMAHVVAAITGETVENILGADFEVGF